MSLATFGTASVSAGTCSDWKERSFFREATVEGVVDCLDGGADPNARGRYWTGTRLHAAAEEAQDASIIAALLLAGADPNAVGPYGVTPLSIAVRRGYHVEAWSKPDLGVEIVATLLHFDADPNSRDSNGCTPLHEAAGEPFIHPAIIPNLLHGGAEPDVRGCSRYSTPLHAAIFGANISTIAALLDDGADPNLHDNDGNTPIRNAILSINDPGSAADVVSLLLAADADPNVAGTGHDQRLPLHIAAYYHGDNPRLVVALLNAGADPNATDEFGNLALHIVTDQYYSDWQLADQVAVIDIMIDAGADKDMQNAAGIHPDVEGVRERYRRFGKDTTAR
ncbi:MAG: ankyrin repeat domain-containing protein [Spirochaetaceae bacterium]|nr:ankyrin repeat domain-containing protein [Spirochaetaceae bacterium]